MSVKMNDLQTQARLLHQIKLLIVFEAILGVNRLYLYDEKKKVLFRLSVVYNMFLVLLSVIILISTDIIYSTSQLMFKDVMAIEYLLLALAAIVHRKKLKNFLQSLQSLDEMLNVENDNFFVITKRYTFLVIAAILSYNIIETLTCVLLNSYNFGDSYSILGAFLSYNIRETETIFICLLLSMLLKRLCVIRAHVAKVFSVNLEIGKNCTRYKKTEDALKKLAFKVELDVTNLHKAYDSLHNCSEQLNSILSIPVI